MTFRLFRKQPASTNDRLVRVQRTASHQESDLEEAGKYKSFRECGRKTSEGRFRGRMSPLCCLCEQHFMQLRVVPGTCRTLNFALSFFHKASRVLLGVRVTRMTVVIRGSRVQPLTDSGHSCPADDLLQRFSGGETPLPPPTHRSLPVSHRSPPPPLIHQTPLPRGHGHPRRHSD